MVKNNDIYTFENLSAFPSVVHGFSTRATGDMRRDFVEKSISIFSQALSFPVTQCVFMEQVHGGRIFTKKGNSDRFVAETDGMVTADRNAFLCVRTADCVPILAYDPQIKIVGVVHAGWRGIIGDVVVNFISAMEDAGSDPKDIIVGIGPSIRDCCYAIDEERMRIFAEKFSDRKDVILTMRGELVYLSLQEAVILQLQGRGVVFSHIEDSKLCTKDHTDDFFSFRDEKEAAGHFAGIIGMR